MLTENIIYYTVRCEFILESISNKNENGGFFLLSLLFISLFGHVNENK